MPATTPSSDEPEATEPTEATEPDATAGTGADEPAPDVPLNRAERRAKGRTKGQAPTYGPNRVTGGKGPGAGPRLWANRRSG